MDGVGQLGCNGLGGDVGGGWLAGLIRRLRSKLRADIPTWLDIRALRGRGNPWTFASACQ